MGSARAQQSVSELHAERNPVLLDLPTPKPAPFRLSDICDQIAMTVCKQNAEECSVCSEATSICNEASYTGPGDSVQAGLNSMREHLTGGIRNAVFSLRLKGSAHYWGSAGGHMLEDCPKEATKIPSTCRSTD